MNSKQIGGFVLIAIGLYLIFFAIHSMHEMADAKKTIDDVSDFFTHNPTWNPIVTFFGGKAQEKVSQYTVPVMICLISGIVCTLFGSLVAIVYRVKK